MAEQEDRQDRIDQNYLRVEDKVYKMGSVSLTVSGKAHKVV